MKIGVFGGTFNPIHCGHLRAAEEAREALSLDRVLFVPAGNPPLKSGDIAEAGKRYRMVEMAIAGNSFFEVLDIECSRGGKSFTVDTLEELQGRHPGSELYFILGIDAFLDIPNWWMPERLIALTHFILLARPGTKFSDLPASPYLADGRAIIGEIDGVSGHAEVRLISGRKAVLLPVTPLAISSTEIRRRLRTGLSIKYLLPEQVESFIISNKLYRSDE